MNDVNLVLNWLFNATTTLFNFCKNNIILSFGIAFAIFKFVVDVFNKLKKIF